MSDTAVRPALSRGKIQRIFGAPFIDGNQVTLLWKGREHFDTIFAALRKAEKLICLQFYIFRDDDTGSELAGILMEQAAKGITVCILYDHFGSLGTPRAFWERLKAAGIRIRASRPFAWASPLRYLHRDHRKLIIIDQVSAFTGGLNIANEYRGHRRRREESWRDTGIFIEGPVVASLTEEFVRSWELWGGEPLGLAPPPAPLPNGVPALPIFASSAKGRRRMRKTLYYSINGAVKSIYLTTAYFTPSRRMIQILEAAVLRGVQVRLLLPGRSDVTAAQYAGRAFFTRLLRAGVEIYTYNGPILHAKTAVFDGLWSIIGSANLDFRSLRRNDEGNVGILDLGFGQQMTGIFGDDLGRADRVDLEEWLRRPLGRKMKEYFFALFRRRL